jgi:pimeloyl-ACP methyl ester carboxylesterase
VAARLALENPEAGGMVLISSATLAPPGSASAQAAGTKHADDLRAYEPSLGNMRKMTLNTIFKPELVTDELVEFRYQMSIGKNREAALERAKTKPARPVFEDLRSLKMPIMIMTGRNDRGVPLERSILLFESIPGAEMHIFDNCAHFVQWDQADRVNQLVAGFLPR